MGLVDVRFKIGGDAQYVRAFEMLEHEAGDLSDPLDEFADHLIATIGAQFATEGARTGTPWQRLSDAYRRWKQAHFPGRPLLVQTGEMRDLMLDKERTVTVTDHSMRYEVDLDRAGWHQEGRGHNPARRMVDLGTDDRRAVDRIFSAWLNEIRRGPLRHSRQGRR